LCNNSASGASNGAVEFRPLGIVCFRREGEAPAEPISR